MKKKVLFDRIMLKTCIKTNTKEIEKNIFKEKTNKKISINKFKCCYIIKKKFFNLYYYPKKKILILDLNMHRYFFSVNIGTISLNESKEIINKVNFYLKNTIKENLNIENWEIIRIELKKDIVYNSKYEKEAILSVFKKCTKGNLRFGNYKNSYYRYTKSRTTKINVYDKEEQLKDIASGSIWKKMSLEEKKLVHNAVRFEVEFNQKRLKKILNVNNKVLFKNLLCIETQQKIYDLFFLEMGFIIGKIPTKTQLVNKIKELGYSSKKTKNLINVILILNSNNFSKAKELIPSIYNYLKIFKQNNLPIYFFDEEKLLKEIIKNNKEKTNIIDNIEKTDEPPYNIYYIFNNKLSYLSSQLE